MPPGLIGRAAFCVPGSRPPTPPGRSYRKVEKAQGQRFERSPTPLFADRSPADAAGSLMRCARPPGAVPEREQPPATRRPTGRQSETAMVLLASWTGARTKLVVGKAPPNWNSGADGRLRPSSPRASLAPATRDRPLRDGSGGGRPLRSAGPKSLCPPRNGPPTTPNDLSGQELRSNRSVRPLSRRIGRRAPGPLASGRGRVPDRCRDRRDPQAQPEDGPQTGWTEGELAGLRIARRRVGVRRSDREAVAAGPSST